MMMPAGVNSRSKGPEDSEAQERDEVGHENTTDDKVRGYVVSYDAASSFGGPQKEGRFRGRGRVTEYRQSRGGGRGSSRGRSTFPRLERGHNENSYSTSDNWGQRNHSSKYYDRSDLAVNLPEDPRISKLLRRLCAEVDIEKALAICSKLQDAVMLPDNSRYIRRSYDILVESLLNVLYDAPGPEVKESAAAVLGRIGYVMGPDFRKHLEWIATNYAGSNSSVKHLLILSFSETFQLDSQSSNLGDFSETTLDRLQVIIEGTDSAEVFMAAINAMILLSNIYPENFARHFVDTVDILVGWHVDNSQPKKIKDFALLSLFKLSSHWQADLGFSVNLLNQFIEDMVAYSSGIDHVDDIDGECNTPEDCMLKIASFLNVYITVVRSLGNLLNPAISQTITWTFLNESATKIIQVLTKIMNEDTQSDLIIAGNDCIMLLLDYLQAKAVSCMPALNNLIILETKYYLNDEGNIIVSVLNLVSNTIRAVASNLTIEFIVQIVGSHSLLRPLRYSENSHVLNGIVTVYSSLLNLKNIPLLQETYKYVLTDIQNSFQVITPEVAIIQSEYFEEVTPDDAEKNIIFYLQCLSELANASNSIIGMWALQPSILELLAIKMCPHNPNLGRYRPSLQYSIVYLLYSHCKKNNHFIASSDLVTSTHQRSSDVFGLANLTIGDVSSSSPTSGHLSVILNLLSMILERDVPENVLILVLTWISDLFNQLDKYLPTVSRFKAFMMLVTNIVSLGNTFDNRVLLLVVTSLKILLRNKSLHWNIVLLKNVAVLSLLHIDNNDRSVAHICSSLLLDIPWDILQIELEKQKIKVFSTKKVCHEMINSDSKNKSFKEYLMHACSGNLSTPQFKMTINCILKPAERNQTHKLFLDTFLCTWPLQSTDIDEASLLFFRHCAIGFATPCIGWVLSEIAQTCVNLKLRTALGKPQETFTKIEGALKIIARETSSLETKYTGKDNRKVINVVMDEQTRSRWITEFMVFLEKYVYNAAEGTAIVLPAVAKPVKTFFHTNWPTCREWMTRVRPAALAVSLYSGHFGAAVYHAQIIIQTAAHTTTNFDIEAILMSISRALIKLREPELLHGLYVWIKLTFDKKFLWLKAAAEQANSRHDIAIEYYKKLTTAQIKDDEKSGETTVTDTRSKKFIDEQIMECYKNVQNWEDMQIWKEEHLNKGMISHWNSFTALRFFEEGTEIPEELGTWDVLNFDDKDVSKNSCSYQNVLNRIESTLVSTAINMYYTDEMDWKFENNLKCFEKMLKTSFQECSRSNAVHLLKDISILQLANRGLLEMAKSGKVVHNPFKPSTMKEHKYDTNFENLSKILWWNQYFTKVNITEENIFYNECLRLDVIKAARKQSNFSMAKRELLRHFKNNSSFQLHIGNANSLEELNDFLNVSNNMYEMDIWSLNNVTAFIELCKLSFAKETSKIGAINLCANISLGFSQRLAMGEQAYELREKGTRMLLTLSKWVQTENENILGDTESPLFKLVSALPEIGLVDNNISENVIPIMDSAVGKLLQFGVNQCPGLAKAWASFASWCFRWGRKMVEFSAKTGEKLTDNDKIQIESIMIGCTPQDFEAVCEILSKTKASCDDEDIDWNEINTSEMIENQLRSVPSLCNAFPEHLTLLVDIWRQAQKRVFSYFELSADAYFKFLQLICASDYINHSGEYAVVSATLRLLRLIVKHAMELQTVLETGLANTPTQPWKVIIPQLFSRLNHPETYVRKCVSDLLCRLAEDTPHLITFPAVVGAFENEKSDLANLSSARSFITNDAESVGQDCDIDDTDSEKMVNNELNSCFLDMVDTLSKQAPTTIMQVKILVKELQRINLLWDELWLGTLAQHHSDFTKRLSQLEQEIVNVKENQHLTPEEKDKLIKDKHDIIFEPIVYVLEQINQITSAPPETPHEIAFQNRFQILINNVVDKLKNPDNPEKPQESWAPLKQLQLKLQQKVNKRTSYILKMSDISPTLAEMRDTVITMPGLYSHQRQVRITIKGIENNVAILPTKTRPKKLVFYGSDGKPYTYLFKGMEDLHLDERIMQLLSITNTMLARDSENNDNQTYRARHYSVIPLGSRSGLISWVENVTALFALYKRWQNREAAMASAKTNKTVPVPRPSELYYKKLRDAGITTDNRKDWPVSVLKEVLKELSDETPKDLLWRELWCGSVTPEQWWQMVRRYSYSMAVMSTIGYIIGLGDRHLDNVLVDLTSGEVVHIDYNVCFEKGKTLRVPEKVPFRLTPNLVTALGVTGVEGIFRLACEHVLKIMRRGRETLLTLLEAFVYDPLVEWGPGAGAGAGGHKRRRSQRDVRASLAMLATRTVELRHQMNENVEQFLAILPEIKKAADNWIEKDEALKAVETRLQECHQQMALIKEIEAYGANLSNHPLYAISTKYASYKQAKNAVEDSMKVIVKIINEFDTQIENYATTNEILNGPQLMAWVQEFSGPNEEEDIPIFEHIKEFLINAGQSSMWSQCEQVEAELKKSMHQTINFVRQILEQLTQHVTISQYYPQSLTEYHRLMLFRKWLATALESKSPEVCREMSAQVTALINADNIAPNSPAAQEIINYNYRLTQLCAEADANLAKTIDKLQLEGGPDALRMAQEAYREAKANISNWVRTEEGAPAQLESAVMEMLCAVNKRYLVLDKSAQSAGDCLVDLTSREGEWFLDEMTTLSIQSVELLSLLPLQTLSAEDPIMAASVECVRNANLLLSDLVQLNYNFSTIILPEAMMKTHAEEPTTLMMIAELNNLVLSSPVPLNELLKQLEVHLKYVAMDMESPAVSALALSAELRARYDALLSGPSGQEGQVGGGGQTPGRTLALSLNGLLVEAELRARRLPDSVAVPVPRAWHNTDQLADARQLSAHLQSPGVRAVLEHVTSVRRIQCVAETLGLVAQVAAGFRSGGALYDHDTLCRPVKRWTAEVVSRWAGGVSCGGAAAVLCGLLARRHLDLAAALARNEIGAMWCVPLCSLVPGGGGGGGCGGTASALTSAMAVACERAARLGALARRRAEAHTAARDLTDRRVAHSRLLMSGGSRWSAALRGAARGAGAAGDSAAAAAARAHALLSAARNRLKWGVGANPALEAPLTALESSWLVVSRRQRAAAAAAVRLARAATAAASTAAGEHSSHQRTLKALLHWEKACILAQKYSLNVSGVEESLMEMLHPEGNIDQQWVSQVSCVVRDVSAQLSSSAVSVREAVSVAAVACERAAAAMAATAELRANIAQAIEPDLMALAAHCQGMNPAAEFLSLWQEESELVSALSRAEPADLRRAAPRVRLLADSLPATWDRLAQLPSLWAMQVYTKKPKQAAPAAHVAGVRSAWGAGVWRRVRHKLRRAAQPGALAHSQAARDQVDTMIKEALSVDNLCVMYEGWMAWV